MTVQGSEETSSGGKPDAETVANQFLHQYYIILHKSPELLHKFYKDHSSLKWPGVDSATTMEENEFNLPSMIQGIHDKIMSSDYAGCQVKVINADAQESLMEGIILTVNGCLLGNDNVKKIISQTFFLAKQEKGFFVLNDNLQIIDAQGILNHSFAYDVDESVSIASYASSANESEPIDDPVQPEPVKEPISTEATDIGERAPEVTVKAAEIPKQPVTSTQDVSPFVTSKDIPQGQKISYASVVVKERKTAPPTENSGHKIIRVAPSSNQQPVASPAPIVGNVTKERTSSSHGSTENNRNIHNNSSNNFRSEAPISRSVYIQNLPSDITKNELADVVKKFGQVKPADIQIRTFEDGFCFGFVEFESATSAQSAVEARSINVKGYDARISFKKSGTRAGNGARTGGGFRGRNFQGQEKGEIGSNGTYRDDNRGDFAGRARGFDRQNREFGQRNSQSTDGRGHGGESYPRNSRRNEEKWSNGGH